MIKHSISIGPYTKHAPKFVCLVRVCENDQQSFQKNQKPNLRGGIIYLDWLRYAAIILNKINP